MQRDTRPLKMAPGAPARERRSRMDDPTLDQFSGNIPKERSYAFCETVPIFVPTTKLYRV